MAGERERAIPEGIEKIKEEEVYENLDSDEDMEEGYEDLKRADDPADLDEDFELDPDWDDEEEVDWEDEDDEEAEWEPESQQPQSQSLKDFAGDWENRWAEWKWMDDHNR